MSINISARSKWINCPNLTLRIVMLIWHGTDQRNITEGVHCTINQGLIDWCLMPTLAVLQLFGGIETNEK